MTTYKIQFKLKSSIRTPFQSDTIFGHLCWAMRYLEGEDRLREWLNNYQTSPTLISNAFPDGKFPRPILPPLPIQKLGKLKGFSTNPVDIKTAIILKKMKKILFVNEEWVINNQASFSMENLSSLLFDMAKQMVEEARSQKHKTVKDVAITHNTYDRLNGRVLGGSLYDWVETFYIQPNGDPQTFWFLVKTDTLNKNEIENLLEFISLSGFGADKSIGKGQIEITDIKNQTFPECPNANAFISLSNFIPAKPEDLNGYYKPLTKYGKLGGEWATGRVPFKKPVVMLQAGAVIVDANYAKTKQYGRLQTDIHRQKEVVHYGYAFPFPICLKEEN